jgi:hypothetical protein
MGYVDSTPDDNSMVFELVYSWGLLRVHLRWNQVEDDLLEMTCVELVRSEDRAFVRLTPREEGMGLLKSAIECGGGMVGLLEAIDWAETAVGRITNEPLSFTRAPALEVPTIHLAQLVDMVTGTVTFALRKHRGS